MKRSREFVRAIALALFVFTFALPSTNAQNAGTRQSLIGIISMDCGVGEAAERFRTVLAKSGEAATPILLELLAGGAPAELREKTRNEAVTRHGKLADWARRHPDRAHARSFSERTTLEGYVAEQLDSLDLAVRSNALRGLEIVGPADAGDAIRRAIGRDPRLMILGTRALEAK